MTTNAIYSIRAHRALVVPPSREVVLKKCKCPAWLLASVTTTGTATTRASLPSVVAMSRFGEKSAALVRDLSQSERGTIPQFADETVRGVLDECQEHHRSILRLIDDIKERGTSLEAAAPADAASILVHHQAVLRNKRALLVYMNERMRRVRDLRWEVGAGLPDLVAESLSHAERTFFTAYSALLNKYQGRRHGVGLNVTLDKSPPEDHKVEVRALEDYGEIVTRDGSVELTRNSVHLMWRDECQPLIQEGVLEQL